MKYDINIVTGAPGSGKSTALEAFLSLETEYIAFDIDWLAESAGRLANKNIFTDSSTWKPYGAL
jgi:dephospho-CoA kinase